MSTPLILTCVWVIAGAITATLPMRRQYVPGAVLVLSAPVLIIWLSIQHGWWVGILALLAVASMMRRPLGALGRRIWAHRH